MSGGEFVRGNIQMGQRGRKSVSFYRGSAKAKPSIREQRILEGKEEKKVKEKKLKEEEVEEKGNQIQ